MSHEDSCSNIASRLTRIWQERQGSNPRPLVLETNALPTELRSYVVKLGMNCNKFAVLCQ